MRALFFAWRHLGYLVLFCFCQERIKDFQEKRTAAAGSRRAKTAQKRSAQHATKRDNKRKGMKAKKKGREAAIAATAAKAKANAEGCLLYTSPSPRD